MHTKASWPARHDRRTAFVWLAAFWIFIGVGFGCDLHNYLHESPPVPTIVHFHAVATTLWLLLVTALVFLVEAGNVKLHRLLGWFVAGFAVIVVVIAPVSELSWQALNLHTPGALPPQFLSIAFAGVFCLILLLPYGILLRRNPAAHRRVMMLAAISMSDAGFSRMVSLFVPAPTGFLGTYLFYEGGNLAIVLFMLLWDWKRDRVMKQFVQGALLLVGVEVTGTCLYFSPTWQSIARGWLEAWARHGWIH
ncbi:MAG TPA: hypothetical protein VHW46_02280 [Terracidiphilus sp.]|nr:hypothetical protein [Terracidiphilus sp.]